MWRSISHQATRKPMHAVCEMALKTTKPRECYTGFGKNRCNPFWLLSQKLFDALRINIGERCRLAKRAFAL
jgi:hypothetical protein